MRSAIGQHWPEYLMEAALLGCFMVSASFFATLPGASAASSNPASEPTILASGSFHDGAHKTSGTTLVLRLAGGQRVLRLTNFATSNGPDVQVYLGKAADATDSDTVKSAGFTNLGPMKGNLGDQNYDIPADLDLAKHHSVTIWCQRFGVNFGTAPLSEKAN